MYYCTKVQTTLLFAVYYMEQVCVATSSMQQIDSTKDVEKWCVSVAGLPVFAPSTYYYVLLLYCLWYVGGIDSGVKLLTFHKCDSTFFQFSFLFNWKCQACIATWQFEISNLATWKCVLFLCSYSSVLFRNTPVGNYAQKGWQYICIDHYLRR